MKVPSPQHPVWLSIVTGQKKVSLNFLAAKILIGRAKIEMQRYPEKSSKLALELYGLFSKNSHLPSVQKDLQNLA